MHRQEVSPVTGAQGEALSVDKTQSVSSRAFQARGGISETLCSFAFNTLWWVQFIVQGVI